MVMAMVSVLCALSTCLLNNPIDYLFEILAAPTADASKLSAADTLMKRTGRRVSSAARRMSNVTLNAVTAAVKANTQRISMIGTVTREIPPATLQAHAMAQSSVGLLRAALGEICWLYFFSLLSK